MHIMNNTRIFSDAEIEQMHALYAAGGITAVRKHFRCGYEAAKRHLGFTTKHVVKPSKERMQQLVDRHGTTFDGKQRIAEALGLKKASINKYLQRYKLNTARFWSHDQDMYLQMHAYFEPWEAIAAHVHRSVEAVKIRANQLGLRRQTAFGYTPKQLAADLQMNDTTIHAWIKNNGLPIIRQGRARIIISESDVLEWLEAGNILRLPNIAKLSATLRAMRKHAEATFIGSVALNRYYHNTRNKFYERYIHLARLNTAEHGTVYHRAELFPHVRMLAPFMKRPAHIRTPDDAYIDALHISFDALYIHNRALSDMCRTTYHTLVRSGCTVRQPMRGYWLRADVIAYLQQIMPTSRNADVYRVTLQMLQDDAQRARHVPHTWQTPPRLNYTDV